MQVGGLDVAVDHVLAVQMAERFGDLGGGAEGVGNVKRCATVELLLQGFAVVPVVDDVIRRWIVLGRLQMHQRIGSARGLQLLG